MWDYKCLESALLHTTLDRIISGGLSETPTHSPNKKKTGKGEKISIKVDGNKPSSVSV